jgi:ubiquinone biosynthesis UbiH/UbiF/VisC/COQ6 family hydroxylase
MKIKADIVIIGAGPAGLSFACSLIDTGLKVLVLEKLAVDTFKNPLPDGREIALTHLSVKILKKIGVWKYLNSADIAPLKTAQVFNGESETLLDFKPKKPLEALGYLVSNFQIRKALYRKIEQAENITLIDKVTLEQIEQTQESASILLATGEKIEAKLLIAADSRFSEVRRKMGIPALMQDFSKVMIVTKMNHAKPHQYSALEYFKYGKTLALLPMKGNFSSVVLTFKTDESKKIMAMDEAGFNDYVTGLFKHKLGEMAQVDKRHTYPLVATHAKTFIAKRFALIGDAAVGMHPVTAHGFNLGLRGQAVLADLVKEAHNAGQDIGAPAVLSLYEKKQIGISRLMFFGTNGVVSLFTNDAPILKPIRKMVLTFAQHFPPIKYFIANHLTDAKSNKPFPF